MQETGGLVLVMGNKVHRFVIDIEASNLSLVASPMVDEHGATNFTRQQGCQFGGAKRGILYMFNSHRGAK